MLFIFLAAVLFFSLAIFYIFFYGNPPEPKKNIIWGVNFSQMQAEHLGLDWKEFYSHLIADLGVKNIKLITNWDWIEGKKDDFYFDDVDWQLKTAQDNNINIIYVTGMKTGRWPECHIPQWAKGLSKEQQQAEILKYLKEVILKYKDNKTITAWQVENEPLFPFGQCPWIDVKFLKKEVDFVKSLDSSRPVIVSDSGEGSSWFRAASIGDIVGTTLYRKIWFTLPVGRGIYINEIFTPITYWNKAQIIKKIFGKKVICVELQAEPWINGSFKDSSLAEQAKTMNLEQFKLNIDFAKKTGFDAFYLWGAEWWYWMKEKQSQPQIWNEAAKLFRGEI